MSAIIHRTRKVLQFCFTKNLLLTNTCLTVGLGSTGDYLQQYYERLKGKQLQWDVKRTRTIFAANCVLGPVCHYWYIFLERCFTGKSLKILAKKVLLDQALFSPAYILVFFGVIGVLENMSIRNIVTDLNTKGLHLFKTECLVWPPAQVVNFSIIPLRYRVLFDNAVSLGFDVYYSRIKYGSKIDE